MPGQCPFHKKSEQSEAKNESDAPKKCPFSGNKEGSTPAPTKVENAEKSQGSEKKCPYSAKPKVQAALKKCPYGSTKEESDYIKQATAEAYNKVGETGHIQGNLKKAYAIMRYLDYTEEEIDYVKNDCYNYQGVGCPFRNLNIAPGDVVLDVGSGLGIDSTIAWNKTGPTGQVIGLDISEEEVKHANSKFENLGMSQDSVKFICCDMENMPEDFTEKFDKVTSNGAVCVAPNKKLAFSQIFRVLKPGGQAAVCLSVMRQKLDENVNWPICLRTFMPENEIIPLLTQIGFQNVKVDDSNSLMQYDLKFDESTENSGENGQDETMELNPDKNRIHNNAKEFAHMANFDINAMTARVVVIAEKP